MYVVCLFADFMLKFHTVITLMVVLVQLTANQISFFKINDFPTIRSSLS